MSTVASTSSPTALQQPFEGQSWILPDKSLVLLMNAGTTNFNGAGTNHTIVLQSSNWQNASPTWSFVKQITTTSNEVAASWWDGTRLHIAYANASAGNASGLFYISASYASSTWTWDSSPVTLVAAADPTNTASSPSIIVDSRGVVYVAYRNQAIATDINSVCMFTKSAGVWSGSPVQMSATSGTSGTYYGAMSYGNNTVVLITVENASYYAQAHPDSGSWGATSAGPTAQVGTGQQYGPVSVVADGNGGAWVGISSTHGLNVEYLTFSGSAISWSGSLTNIDTSNNVSAPQWLFCSGTLYGYYFKTTATNQADVYTVQYNPTTARWTTPTNLTNNTANNNSNPVVPANYAFSGSLPVMPYIYEVGTASPFTITLGTLAPLSFAVAMLPGQVNVNGVSNYIFGTNLAQDVNTNDVYNTAAIQQQIKNGNFQVMRCGVKDGASNASIDKMVAAVTACGCTPLVNLQLTDLAYNISFLQYLQTNHTAFYNSCLMFEIGNEPDGAAAGNLTGAQYYNNNGVGWANQVPTLRTYAPVGSFFIGPVVTHLALPGASSGARGTFIHDWLTLCAAAGGTMLPDAISWHSYPCTGKSQATCSTLSTSFSAGYTSVDQVVRSILGYSLPQCLTEWNVGGGSPPPSYTQDFTYVANWIYQAIDNMVNAGFSLACQFEAGTGEGGTLTSTGVSNGAGGLDLIYAISPYAPGPDYQPIVVKNVQYLQHAASGALMTFNRRNGAGLSAIARRDGTGLAAIARRNGSGIGTINRRSGSGVVATRRSGQSATTKRRG